MEKNLNQQDSLRLINEMIAQTRNNIRIGSANAMIFCGYYVAIVAVLNIALLHLLPNPHLSFWVWTLTIPMLIISRIISSKQDKQAIIRTPIDRIVSKVWIGFSLSIAIFLGAIFAAVFLFDHFWTVTVLIMPATLVLTGLAQYITGWATNFKPFINGAYIFWLGALVSIFGFLVVKHIDIQFVILALCMVAGFIVPGYMLNRKAKKHV